MAFRHEVMLVDVELYQMSMGCTVEGQEEGPICCYTWFW